MYSTALSAFIEKANNWISLEKLTGSKAVAAKYLDLLKHSPPPEKGYIASID